MPNGLDVPGGVLPSAVGVGQTIINAIKDPFGITSGILGLFGGGQEAVVGGKVFQQRIGQIPLRIRKTLPEDILAAVGRGEIAPESAAAVAEARALAMGVSEVTGRPPSLAPDPTMERARELGFVEAPPLMPSTMVPAGFVPDVPPTEFDIKLGGQAMAIDLPVLLSQIGRTAVDIASIFRQGFPTGGVVQPPTVMLPQPVTAGIGGVPAVVSPTAISRIGAIVRAVGARLGVTMTLARLKSIIRFLGPTAAGAVLGLSLQDIAAVQSKTTRRRRGITAGDLKAVRRTARRFRSISCDLSDLCHDVPKRPRRRKPC